jgi:TRAP-type C4-dicarboxylate transport system permease small subunit
VILVVVLGIIYFIIRWISANWSTILLIIEIVGSIIIVAAVLYAIYYFRNYDEIQREKQRQKEIDERAKEIRRERQLSERFSKYNKNESSEKILNLMIFVIFPLK